MNTFICRYCGKTGKVYPFRSRFPNVCLSCYRARVHQKTRGATAKYIRLRYNAKKMGVPMTITKDQFEEYQKLDCHYCLLPVSGRSSIDARDNTGSGLSAFPGGRLGAIEGVFHY